MSLHDQKNLAMTIKITYLTRKAIAAAQAAKEAGERAREANERCKAILSGRPAR